MRRREAIFRDRRVSLAAGLLAAGAAWALLFDAYDRRGIDQPRLLRVFSWW